MMMMMIVGQLVGAVVATAQELEMLGRDAQLAQTSISVSNHSELITLVADNILQLLHSDHLIKVRWLHITACSSPSFFLFFYFLSHCILSFCCLMANKDFIIYIHMYIYIYIYISTSPGNMPTRYWFWSTVLLVCSFVRYSVTRTTTGGWLRS